MRTLNRSTIAACALIGLTACGDEPTGPLGADGCTPVTAIAPAESKTLRIRGLGPVTTHTTAEVDARGSHAYTTTYGAAGVPGNTIFVWNVAGDVPQQVNSVVVSGATTLGDVAISDDGSLLVVATERAGGSIVIYSLANPAAPVQLARFTNAETNPGVHTAEIGRVNGRLYAFLSIDPQLSPTPIAAKLVIVDLGDPANPAQVYSKTIGDPYVHDVFLRDGILFLALWNDGIEIWDLGGAGNGSPASPRKISSLVTVDGSAHNLWWFHDPATGSKAYLFVGEEGPATSGVQALGDVHVVDICNLADPREVAFYHVPDAGAHNFSMDESRGILYAAFYNGGVRALDVRGNLGDCPAASRAGDGRCDLGKMGREVGNGLVDIADRYIWGVVFRDGFLYASDMNNGLWKLSAVGTP